jgi:ectoine hydroxylase-related dioxygenase (phytanoyl-CoA dioxygenase family)
VKDVISFFLQAGYVRAPGRLPEELLGLVDATLRDLFENPSAPYRTSNDGTVYRVDWLLSRHPIFLEILRSEVILGCLEMLLGPDIEVLLHRHNHATLNRAGDVPFRLHRDVQQWSRPVLDVLIYLEDSDPSNGCTHVVPGSQNLPYPGPQSLDGGGTWADEHPELQFLIGQELPVPMSRGGVLLLNGLVFHSIGRNSSLGTRRSMVFACRSSDELALPSRRSALQLCGQPRFRGNPPPEVQQWDAVPCARLSSED